MAQATSPVIVYSAGWCAFCHMAKEYLDKLGIKYDDRDVESKKEFMDEAVDKSHQMGIPVLDISGDIIVGFDRPKIDAALKAHKIS
ncbi:MAG TPA: glutaredoxin domain-containing protein [Candidatus Saccharimonadales bacterium]